MRQELINMTQIDISQMQLGSELFQLNEDFEWQNDKAKIIVKRGTIWTDLLLDGEKIGIAYKGDITLIIDAIMETIDGAVGSTIENNISGLGIIVSGNLDIKNKSQHVDLNSEYISAFQTMLELLDAHKSNVDIDFEDDKFIALMDSHIQHIFISNRRNIVYVRKKEVLTLSNTKMTRIDKNGILIARVDRRPILINRKFHKFMGLISVP